MHVSFSITQQLRCLGRDDSFAEFRGERQQPEAPGGAHQEEAPKGAMRLLLRPHPTHPVLPELSLLLMKSLKGLSMPIAMPACLVRAWSHAEMPHPCRCGIKELQKGRPKRTEDHRFLSRLRAKLRGAELCAIRGWAKMAKRSSGSEPHRGRYLQTCLGAVMLAQGAQCILCLQRPDHLGGDLELQLFKRSLIHAAPKEINAASHPWSTGS